IRAIWSRHQCVAGRLAGSSPVTIVAPGSKVKDGNIALHVWTFPQKSGAASQRLLIVHVSGAAGLFLSAVELMPSTTQRSAPRPPKTRDSGGIRAKFFNKIKGRKTSSLDRTIGRSTSSAATAVEETSVAITARWRHKRHRPAEAEAIRLESQAASDTKIYFFRCFQQVLIGRFLTSAHSGRVLIGW